VLRRLKALSLDKKIGIGVISLFTLAAIGGGGSNSQQTTGDKPDDQAQIMGQQNETKVEADKVEIKQETKTEVVPFTSLTINDSSLLVGTTKIATVGVNGEKTIIYEVTYTNGVETDRKVISEEITKQPVNEVKKEGTKTTSSSCSGGYINSQGNCVQSPGSSPVGATARCRDGTYSYSQSRSGTCSHHGGVAEWL